MERGSPDRRRFIAALVGGQLAGLMALVVFGGWLLPMLVAFMGAGAGCFVVAEPRQASRRLELPGAQQAAGRAPRAR